MAYTLRYKHGPAMAVAEVSCLAFIETAEPVLLEIEAHTQRHRDRRLLVNLRDVVGTMGPQEHALIGKLAVRHLAHLERVASLVAEDKITRVSEGVARAQGMQLRVFTQLTEAVAWLLDE